MEEIDKQIDPNLNADAYRNLSAADHPPIRDKQLEVVLAHKDGGLILGASNMVDRYWSGTLCYYDSIENFDQQRYTVAMRTESGILVAAYLGKHDKFVIGEDSGLIQVFELVTNEESKAKEFNCMGYACQHDEGVSSISTFHDNNRIVSSSTDASIKIWDTTEMLAINTFGQAQTDMVTSVVVQVGSDSIFVSTSMDCEALLWDIRKAKPAIGLWKKPECPLTSATWKTDDENTVAVGGIDGSINILDIRYVNADPLHTSIQFPRGVRRLLYNSDCPTQLAGCCDGTNVKVFDTSKNNKTIFDNDSHGDFVRSIAWYKNDLITCSWDDTVIRHSLSVTA